MPEVRQQPTRTPAQPVMGKAASREVSSLPNVPPVAMANDAPRRSAYGLPCAKCGMYYESVLPACPICKSPERVGPRSTVLPPGVQTSPTQSLPPVVLSGAIETIPDAAALEEERDRFLHELSAQLREASSAAPDGEVLACVRTSAHTHEARAAEICRDCFDHVQESADRMEGALHMDVKEAGKIVYEAVWADTSDPDKTYVNAAQALLNALRSRAGLSSTTPTAPTRYSH